MFDEWSGQLQLLLWELRSQLRGDVDAARLSRFIVAALEGGMLMTRVKRDAAVMEGIGEDLKRFIATYLRDGEAWGLASNGRGGEDDDGNGTRSGATRAFRG